MPKGNNTVQDQDQEDTDNDSDVELQSEVEQVDEEVETEDCAWPDAKTMAIIDLWKERDHLWDLRHKWYHRRDKKDGAHALMATQLKCSVHYLRTRLTSLRTQFTKAKAAQKSGSGPFSARKRRTLQKQRELLSFLEPHGKKWPSKSNIESDEEASDEESIVDNQDKQEDDDVSVTASVEAAPTPKKSKGKGKGKLIKSSLPVLIDSDTDNEQDKEASQSTKNKKNIKISAPMKSQEKLYAALKKMCEKETDPVVEQLDDVGVFCEHVSRELRSIKSKRTRLITQDKIHSILFNVQMEELHQESDTTHPPQASSYHYGQEFADYHGQYSAYHTNSAPTMASRKQVSPSKNAGNNGYTSLQNAPLPSTTSCMRLRPKGLNNSSSSMGSPLGSPQESIVEVPFEKM